MDKTEYEGVDARFRSIFGRYAALLSKEGQNSVKHFIDAAEVEMACESFILSVLEEEVQLSVEDKEALLGMALSLRLDKESVFRADFWKLAGPLLSGSA